MNILHVQPVLCGYVLFRISTFGCLAICFPTSARRQEKMLDMLSSKISLSSVSLFYMLYSSLTQMAACGPDLACIMLRFILPPFPQRRCTVILWGLKAKWLSLYVSSYLEQDLPPQQPWIRSDGNQTVARHVSHYVHLGCCSGSFPTDTAHNWGTGVS